MLAVCLPLSCHNADTKGTSSWRQAALPCESTSPYDTVFTWGYLTTCGCWTMSSASPKVDLRLPKLVRLLLVRSAKTAAAYVLGKLSVYICWFWSSLSLSWFLRRACDYSHVYHQSTTKKIIRHRNMERLKLKTNLI